MNSAPRQSTLQHMDVRGWCDIGYHYLVSANGEVWEGRSSLERGVHTANNNGDLRARGKIKDHKLGIILTMDLFDNSARQRNLWVAGGSGRSPIVW